MGTKDAFAFLNPKSFMCNCFLKKEKAPLSDYSKTPLPFMSPFIHPDFPIVKPFFEKNCATFCAAV
ncbi:MAG: hypothetical protein K6B39_05810, partial [Lachnospiraceae bacterium]|nr:hypothetical protein [Lachnospiraceae bacterium]